MDGLSGPGLCRVREAKAPPECVWGSPLIALRTMPAFEQCILLEKVQGLAKALETRTRAFGSRRVVRKGDVNLDLASLVREQVSPSAPCFCLLDPEGTELHWATIEALAALPRKRFKPELLILFPSNELVRLLPRGGSPDPSHETILDRLMPNG